jgi:hypothetical protein
MKKINIHPSFLQVLYFIIILILFFFITYTPSLIDGPVHITKKLIFEEETIEGILIGILFIISILILNLYKGEVNKHKQLIEKMHVDKKKVEERLLVSDQYIGKINVQIQDIKSIFNNIDTYPQTKAEFKKTFNYFGERIIGIANTNWALIRIINCSTQRTISEHFEKKAQIQKDYPHISNKMIIEKQQLLSHTIIISNPKNLDVLVFCILPVDKITNNERVFIQAIVDEITKLFVIINSSYYKNENENSIENEADTLNTLSSN